MGSMCSSMGYGHMQGQHMGVICTVFVCGGVICGVRPVHTEERQVGGVFGRPAWYLAGSSRSFSHIQLVLKHELMAHNM